MLEKKDHVENSTAGKKKKKKRPNSKPTTLSYKDFRLTPFQKTKDLRLTHTST